MRYDLEVRASICYLEFLRCSCAWDRTKSGIARMHGHGVLALAFIDVEIDQLRSRIYFHITPIDKWQDGCDGDLFWQRLSLPNKTISNCYFSLRLQPGRLEQPSVWVG